MNRKLYIIGTIIICGLLFSGCGKKQLLELPNDAIAFEMGLFEDSEHDQAQFGSIEYNGRIYIMYGTVNNSYKQNCALSCIGYIIQNEQSSSVIDTDNTNRRLYTKRSCCENSS